MERTPTKEKASLAERLLELKALRAEEIAKLNGSHFEDADDVVSDDERADWEEQNAEVAAGGTVYSETLQEIDMAIAWAEAGYDGDCIVCLKPIENDRLSANRSAITCKEHVDANNYSKLEDVQDRIEELHSQTTKKAA